MITLGRRYLSVFSFLLCNLISLLCLGQLNYVGEMDKHFDSSTTFSLESSVGRRIILEQARESSELNSITWINGNDTISYLRKEKSLLNNQGDLIAFQKKGKIHYVPDSVVIQVSIIKNTWFFHVQEDTLVSLNFEYNRVEKKYHLITKLKSDEPMTKACASFGLAYFHKRFSSKNSIVYLNLLWYQFQNFSQMANAPMGSYFAYGLVPSVGYLFWVGLDSELLLLLL